MGEDSVGEKGGEKAMKKHKLAGIQGGQFKAVFTPCIRCGLTDNVSRGIILKGDKLYFLCQDCARHIGYHLFELRKKPLVKSAIKKTLKDMENYWWFLEKIEGVPRKDILEMLGIYDISKEYFHEIVAELL